MPRKYRLVRTDLGALDLSQVLDDQGRPILLKKMGDFVIVNEPTSKHPLIQRFIGAGLKVEEVSLTPVQGPATPVASAVTAPPKPTPEPPKPAPAPTPPVVPDVVPEEVKKEPPAEDEEPPADAPNNASEDTTDDTQRSGKKAKRGKFNK